LYEIHIITKINIPSDYMRVKVQRESMDSTLIFNVSVSQSIVILAASIHLQSVYNYFIYRFRNR